MLVGDILAASNKKVKTFLYLLIMNQVSNMSLQNSSDTACGWPQGLMTTQSEATSVHRKNTLVYCFRAIYIWSRLKKLFSNRKIPIWRRIYRFQLYENMDYFLCTDFNATSKRCPLDHLCPTHLHGKFISGRLYAYMQRLLLFLIMSLSLEFTGRYTLNDLGCNALAVFRFVSGFRHWCFLLWIFRKTLYDF